MRCRSGRAALWLSLIAILSCACQVTIQAGGTMDITGTWVGRLELPESEGDVTLYVRVARDAEGALTASVAVSDADAIGEKADAVSFRDGLLRIELKARDAVIEGRMSADGLGIEGHARQGGYALPLALTRSQPPAARLAPQEGVGGSCFHKNDITYSTEVVTPHVPWAAKLPRGPIKSFFIPSVQYGRDMVELMQRLELKPTTVSIDREWDINCWGIGDYYSHDERGDRDDFRVVYGYVERDLTGPETFEVMVVPGLNGWSRLTRASRDAILRRVQEGAGLVLIHPFVGDVENHPFAGDEPTGDRRVWDISPLVDCPNDTVKDDGYPELNLVAIGQGKWTVVRSHFITKGLSLDLLPEGVVGGRFYSYRPNGEVLIEADGHPVLAVREYGKGRVVALAYVEQGFMPEPVDAASTRIYWDYWEYQYALLVRCLLWAARREAAVALESFTADAGGARVSLSSLQACSVELEIAVKSEFAGALGRHRRADRLKAGGTDIAVPAEALRPASGWPGGRVILDLIVRDTDTGVTLTWGATSFSLRKQATLDEAKLSDAVYREGDTLRASVRASGDLGGLAVRFEVHDDLARVLCAQNQPAAAEMQFEYRLSHFLGRYASVATTLVSSQGAVVDQLRAAPVYVAPAQRRDREYRASIGFASIRPYFSALRQQLLNAGGVQAGTTWTEGVNNGLDIPHSYFGIYWYRRGPTTKEALERAIEDFQRTGDLDSLAYNTRVELFRRTKDKRFLQRNPCFDDPAVVQDLYQRCYASAQAKARYQMDYYFVGDEGSLTSYGDEFDFCWSPHTLAGFREWLKTEHGSLAALNREWNTDFQDWASVVPLTTEEAVACGSYAAWADHRTYMEIVFARAYHTARDGVVAADPEGHIAVSGTQGTTAYNGCDWYRLDQVIDDFLSYAGGNQWDLHRCFAKPGAMIGFWTGYGSSGLGVQNAIWNAAIHNVLYPNIFWIYSYLDPDFTYSNSARDMGEAFRALRLEGIGRLFAESERQQDGIALHFSMPSIHALTIYQKSHPGEQNLRSISGARNGWVQLINNLGMQFDFVSYEQLEQGALADDRYRAFVLPLSVALSPEEVQALRAFAERGGIVIADAGAGAMDDHCAWVEGGAMNSFFGIATSPSEQRLLARMAGPVSVTPSGAAWGLSAEALQGIEAVEPITATTGQALLRVGDTDAVIVRRVGRGWGVYLNVCPDRYGRRRRRPGDDSQLPDAGPAYRALIGSVLGRLGVQPAARVLDASGQPLTGAQVVRYRLGGSEAVAVLTEMVGARSLEGRDGVTVYRDERLGEVARQELTVRLPQPYHVTDARTGENLGYTDMVTRSVLVGDALVLGLSWSPRQIAVTGPGAGRLGEHPEFAIKLSSPGKTVVRCHIFGPDGRLLPGYARNVVIEGDSGAVVFPSAVSDPPGEYMVRVTDVITGAASTTRIRMGLEAPA